jgi:membrane protease YdiL (CAAX protease family)
VGHLVFRVTVGRGVIEVVCRPVSRSWSVYDYLLIWLGGLLGTTALFALSIASLDEDWAIVVSLAGQYVGSLGVFWILTRYRRAKDVGLTIEGGDFAYIGLGLILQIGLALLVWPLSNLLFPEGRPPQELAEVIAGADTAALQVALVAAAVVLGPVTEELMYRGVLLKALSSRGKVFALLVSSAVFALVHLTGLDTDTMLRSAAVVMPPLFILGLVLAWLTQRHGRLGPAIFLHSGWNLLSAFVLLLPADLLEQVG